MLLTPLVSSATVTPMFPETDPKLLPSATNNGTFPGFLVESLKVTNHLYPYDGDPVVAPLCHARRPTGWDESQRRPAEVRQ